MAVHSASLLFAVVGLMLTAPDPAKQDAERLELIVPLADDGTYSLLDFCRASNQILKTTYPLDKIKDRRILISREERNLLRLAALAGIESRFEPERLVLRLPNAESETVRREQQRRLEKLLGVPPGGWPAALGLRLPNNFAPGSRTVLFIHGLHASTDIFNGFAASCREQGVQVMTFDYPNTGSIKNAGERLAEQLRQLQRRHPRWRVAVVAHSMGGLVARYALETAEPRLACVTDVFFLGTPHLGSQVAKHQPLLEFVESAFGGPTFAERGSLGEARDDLQPGSAVLRQLAAAPRPPGVDYHTVAGSRGLTSPKDLPRLRSVFEQFVSRGQPLAEEKLRLLAYFDGLDEIVTGKGDGAVTLRSARLAGVASERTFPLNHLDLVDEDHPEVIRHILSILRWTEN